jgi:hypothetical protein
MRHIYVYFWVVIIIIIIIVIIIMFLHYIYYPTPFFHCLSHFLVIVTTVLRFDKHKQGLKRTFWSPAGKIRLRQRRCDIWALQTSTLITGYMRAYRRGRVGSNTTLTFRIERTELNRTHTCFWEVSNVTRILVNTINYTINIFSITRQSWFKTSEFIIFSSLSTPYTPRYNYCPSCTHSFT